VTRPIPGARPGCLFTIYPADGHEKVPRPGERDASDPGRMAAASGRGHAAHVQPHGPAIDRGPWLGGGERPAPPSGGRRHGAGRVLYVSGATALHRNHQPCRPARTVAPTRTIIPTAIRPACRTPLMGRLHMDSTCSASSFRTGVLRWIDLPVQRRGAWPPTEPLAQNSR
jgi:hypothetical protein